MLTIQEAAYADVDKIPLTVRGFVEHVCRNRAHVILMSAELFERNIVPGENGLDYIREATRGLLEELAPLFINHDATIWNPILSAADKEKALAEAEKVR
jgi:hypothetical protein